MSLLLRKLLANAVVCSLAVPLAFGQAAPKKRAITLDDLGKLERVGMSAISPDGDWVLYSVSKTDFKEDKNESHLWLVKWDGSERLQITYGKEGAGGAKFSPDGKYISFTSSRPGPAKGNQIWLLDRRGGEPQQLTEIKDMDLGGYEWSPDSKKLLLTLHPKEEPEPEEGKPAKPQPIVIDRYSFKHDVSGYVHNDAWESLYIYDIATKKSEKLTTDKNVDEEGAVWSPDDKWIAFLSNHDTDPDRSNNTDVFVVEPKPGSTAKKLTTWTGPDHGRLAWSPDSKSIAYQQGAELKLLEYSQSKPAVVTLDGKVSYPAPKLDRAVSQPRYLPDGSLSYLINDDRYQYPAQLDGTTVKKLLNDELSKQGVVQSWETVGTHTVVSYTTDTKPTELYALENGALRPLTHENDALIAELDLVGTDNVEATASDGNDVHSLLTKPSGFQPGAPVPMILFIHGGPNGQDAHSFDFQRQWLATKGYAELNVNYRGSSGRGQAYSAAIAADWGNKEVLDLKASLDKAISLGVADPNKLCVSGWSYGGILTDYMIASDTRFKCAISGAGTAFTVSFYGVDQYVLQYDNELGKPWENIKLYEKISYPFLEANKRIHTPTMFMGGTSDMNVPLIGGEQMYQALKSLGVPTELVVYPGQFHGFTKPSFIKDRYERWLGWWDKYLQPEKATTADRKK